MLFVEVVAFFPQSLADMIGFHNVLTLYTSSGREKIDRSDAK